MEENAHRDDTGVPVEKSFFNEDYNFAVVQGIFRETIRLFIFTA